MSKRLQENRERVHERTVLDLEVALDHAMAELRDLQRQRASRGSTDERPLRAAERRITEISELRDASSSPANWERFLDSADFSTPSAYAREVIRNVSR